ncbi:MAG: methionyl-tRNA formyltransferase [Candidatus Rifleibacteriota bacterium]
MSLNKYRVVFMGCPDFAVPSLQALVEDENFSVNAVYCMPDKPKGRGKKLAPTPVKVCAQKLGIEVNTPSSFKKFPEEIEKLRSYKPDFLVVVAYGLILPQAVLDIPAIASVNVHASLLPLYRGPAPIHHAIMNGDKVTGNTLMLMNNRMDEGDILATSKVEIGPGDNLEKLHDRLSLDGAKLLIPTLKNFAAGKIEPQPQNHELATYTGKINKELAAIDWNKSAPSLYNLIRAMNPYPGAWFKDGKEKIKVFTAEIGPSTQAAPGTLLSKEKKIQVACGENTSLFLTTLQRPGKSRLDSESFLRGYQFKTHIL